MEASNLKINWNDFIVFCNQTLKKYGSKIKPLEYISKGKKSQLQRIVNEFETKMVLVDAVVNMARSDFLNGRISTPILPNGFSASFSWLFKNEDRVCSVAGGMYANPPEHEPTPEEIRQQQEAARAAELEQRRKEAMEYEEQERERRRRQREFDAAHAATPEEIEFYTRNFRLPDLKPADCAPRHRKASV